MRIIAFSSELYTKAYFNTNKDVHKAHKLFIQFIKFSAKT